MRRIACVIPLLLAAPAPAVDLNDPASPLIVEPWIKGGPIHLAEGRGKQAYVLLFFRTNCPQCRKAVPILSQMQRAYRDLGVTFVGITAETEPAARRFVDAWGDRIDFPIGLDVAFATNTAYMLAYGDPGVPYAFVIDSSGMIVWRGHPLHGLEKRLRRLLPAAASRPWVSPPTTASRPVDVRPAMPFVSAIRFSDARRLPLSDAWKKTFSPSSDVTTWFAVRTTFPVTTATVRGVPASNKLQTVHCKASDWSLVDTSGRIIPAAGFGDPSDFAGVTECTAVITRDAPPRLKMVSVLPCSKSVLPAASTQPSGPPLLTLQTGELSAWLYFPLQGEPSSDRPMSIRYRLSAPMALPP